ncbi:MAG: 3-dehydroquinate synthase [Patescibacteria group bacterium]|jgi:3-dehydroquinate synthase
MKTIIGKNLLSKINHLFDFSKFSKIAVLTDANIQINLMSQISQIEQSLNRELIIITVPSGESQKNIETVKIIWEKMFETGLDRQSLLINLGGGVVSDMGGFAASTFMRGIDFLNIPTTLLAQVDAGIGGKVGIDFDDLKNGIGIFKDPIGVVIDVETLKTLPKRELVSAFGEIIKHGVISGREYFDFVTSKKPEKFNQNELIEIIKKSIKIKSDIVKKDPKESGFRKVLNFGHTIGHAIESLSWKTGNPLLHGEAVAIGMVVESHLACLCHPTHNLGGCTAELIKNAVIFAGLPTKITDIKAEDIMKIIKADKKNIKGEILFSLPKKIGIIISNVKISQKEIKNLLQTILSVN